MTGFRGTFVVPCNQCEIDGVAAAAPDGLRAGSVWRWSGSPVRVDTTAAVMPLGPAKGADVQRRRAARALRKRNGGLPTARAALNATAPDDLPHQLPRGAFVVTDGHASYTVEVIGPRGSRPALFVFGDHMPPANSDLWVVDIAPPQAAPRASETARNVICFTPGTRIACPGGPRPVEDLRPGDQVQTRDDGVRPLMWCGTCRVSGARLHALPHLRPVRVRAGALGIDEPDRDLLISPDHRVLVRGAQAQALFATDEVLVAARDLIDDARILMEGPTRGVVYHHLMLEHHQVLVANGVACESFHPADADLNALEDADRLALIEADPDLYADPGAYGGHARRALTTAETTLLRYGAGQLII